MTRIGLSQRVFVIEEYGERRDCLDQSWTDLLESLGYTPIPLPNRLDNPKEYLNDFELDGVVLTSGNDLAHLDDASMPAPERDEFEIATLEWAAKVSSPVLGVCRGLELLNCYFGGSLSDVEGHVASEHQVEFTGSQQEIDLPEKTDVNSYHDFGIQRNAVGDGLTAIGVAPDDTVECVMHDELPFCGIMWHPERESPSSELDQQIFQHLFGDDN